ncbi:MAG: Holliday junction resolvase RuvX [Deltaproteobacteria bacterium]|nr:MAG: Holliday junction resolvase RuvX [Deltaproteobacteria bacterium]
MLNILAMDLGIKYIGLAICKCSCTMTQVLPHIKIESKKKTITLLLSIINNLNIQTILIGYPEKNSHIFSQSLLYFADFTLILPIKYKILLHDESYSSYLAKSKTYKSKAVSIHSISAKIILESFLYEHI